MIKLLLPHLLVMSVGSFSFAGTSDGGGGVAVRCPKGSSDIALELLDLHEIKIKGEEIADQPTTMGEAIELSAYKLGRHYYHPSNLSVESYINYLQQNVVEKIFTGQSFTNPINGSTVKIEYVSDLPLAGDIGKYHIKPGCSLEHAAYFFDPTNTLKIVSSRWNELSWVDRSALVSHEIHYFLDRYNGLEDFGSANKKTSERARHLVGLFYSKVGVQPKYSSIPISKETFGCQTNSRSSQPTYFAVFKTGANEFTAIFDSIQEYSSAYVTKAVFNGNLNDLININGGEVNSTQKLCIATSEVTPDFFIKITRAQHELPRFQAFTEVNGVKTPLGAEEEIFCTSPF